MSSTDASGDSIVNKGTITAGFNGGDFQIDATHFTNSGIISVYNGDTLFFYRRDIGRPDRQRHHRANGDIGIDGTVTGGTITAASGGIGWLGGGSGTLSGVAVQGTLSQALYNINSSLTLENGTSFAGAGGTGTATINFTTTAGQNSYLYAVGNYTLDNATINIGSAGGYNYIYNDDVGGTGAALTLGSHLSIVQAQNNAAIVSTDASGDSIVNKGTITAGFNGGDFQIDATHFTNSGIISVYNGDTLFFTGAISAALIDSVAIGANGDIGIDGTVTGGTITAASGGIGWLGGGSARSVAWCFRARCRKPYTILILRSLWKRHQLCRRGRHRHRHDQFHHDGWPEQLSLRGGQLHARQRDDQYRQRRRLQLHLQR